MPRHATGHTTGMDILWAGVPMVSLPLETLASRVASSQLLALGCPELVAKDYDDYENIAVRLGVDADYLEALRAKVWLNGRGVVPRGDGGPDSDRPSTLFDVETYAKDLENLYRRMWSRHVKGLEPDHLPPESS